MLKEKNTIVKLYQESIGSNVSEEIKIQADSGYQGILALHKNSETPKKKPRGRDENKHTS